jgi:hypothetical protein
LRSSSREGIELDETVRIKQNMVVMHESEEQRQWRAGAIRGRTKLAGRISREAAMKETPLV